MNIVIDDKIPFLQQLLSTHGLIKAVPGTNIDQRIIKHAEILLIRTITRISTELLHDSNLKFIGSATSGIDHIDQNAVKTNHIQLAHAHGCNSDAVADYILCSVAALQQSGHLKTTRNTAGIIGVGAAGSRVAQKLNQIGFEIIAYDPPKDLTDDNFSSSKLSELNDADLICIHTPLTKSGAHPTFHMIDDLFANQLKPGCVIINAARGDVIDSSIIARHPQLHFCLDVWPNEPNISTQILQQCVLATPHIAGYSKQAKLRGSWMIYKQLCDFLHEPTTTTFEQLCEQHTPAQPLQVNSTDSWQDVVLKIYDPRRHTQQMLNQLTASDDIKNNFIQLRRNYSLRPEFKYVKLEGDIRDLQSRNILGKLGFNL